MSIWMRLPGQSWLGAEVSFLGMWGAMMAAMMLPSLLPVLRSCRPVHALQVAIGYLAVWTLLGAAIFPVGALLTGAGIRWSASATGIVFLAAGGLQFTAWKARHLARCRSLPPEGGAWRQGLRLGMHCCHGCAGPTAILLAVGVMDAWAMGLVTLAVTAERLVPAGGRTVRLLGGIALAVGAVLIASDLSVAAQLRAVPRV